MKLRKAQTDIETCLREEAENNEKMNGVNMDMLEEKPALITQQTKIFREKAQTEGVLSELKVSLILILYVGNQA